MRRIVSATTACLTHKDKGFRNIRGTCLAGAFFKDPRFRKERFKTLN